jgi:CheY-like chemotaxis protein
MNQKTIMVVEDDGDVRDALAELLQTHGYEVLLSEHGADALAQLRAQPHVSAIVLDVTMPVMNGATFRGEQLADPAIAAIPLVLLTGREDIGPLANMLGATACLQKPLVGDTLLRVLADIP